MSLHVELLLRIAVATALGAVIGLGRELHRRPAGLRTHMLASSTFMVAPSCEPA
jgi:putative Mg2+ transporter-C (MgtC) family protein